MYLTSRLCGLCYIDMPMEVVRILIRTKIRRDLTSSMIALDISSDGANQVHQVLKILGVIIRDRRQRSNMLPRDDDDMDWVARSCMPKGE